MAELHNSYRSYGLSLAVLTEDPLEHFKDRDGGHDQKVFVLKHLKTTLWLRSIRQHLNPTRKSTTRKVELTSDRPLSETYFRPREGRAINTQADWERAQSFPAGRSPAKPVQASDQIAHEPASE